MAYGIKACSCHPLTKMPYIKKKKTYDTRKQSVRLGLYHDMDPGHPEKYFSCNHRLGI